MGWVLDGRLHTQPVRLNQAVHSVTVKLPRDPDQVRFDPFNKVLHKLDFCPGDARLRAQLTGAADVIGRIQAGRALAKSGTPANIAALRDAYRSEPFWGVRVEWARALGEAGAQAALEALLDWLAWEQHPYVLEPLLRAVGKYRDGLVAPAVSARLDTGLPYRAAMAAIEALGAQREQAPFDYLAQVAALPSPYGLAQSGALRALAATRRAEALPLLMARVGYGDSSNRARPAAVLALASLARVLEISAREAAAARLTDLLRDPIPRLRQAAVAGLATLRMGAGALEAYRPPLAAQEQVRVDRALAAVRKAEGEVLPNLEKQVDELRDKLRKLEDALAKLTGQHEAAAKPRKKGKKGKPGKRAEGAA